MPTSMPRSLRTQVRRAIAAIVVVSLLLLGLPLAVVLGRLIHSQAVAGLQRDATRAVAAVPDNVIEAGTVVRTPRAQSGAVIGVYDAKGVRVSGVGPRRSALAARAADGREHDGTDSDALSVVVPVLSDTATAGSVRAALPTSLLRRRVWSAWALLAALVVVVVALAQGLAQGAAARISAPFEQLTEAARGLGAGRYDVELPRWDIAEADAAGDALRDGALAVRELVHHERDFVRHASHQLRTPLSGLVLHLERRPPDVSGALERAHHLETTIADLLAMRVLPGTGTCDVVDVVADAVRRWDGPERHVVLRADEERAVGLTASALRQSLDVLIDNAMHHGAGDVVVTVEPLGEHVVVEVSDQGPGFAPGAARGTGLDLVAGVMERVGGSLLVRRAAPRPRVALLLPSAVSRKDRPRSDSRNRATS